MPPDQKEYGDTAPKPPADGSPDVSRFITWWQERVLSARKFHKDAFKRMEEDSNFIRGLMWDGQKLEEDARYTVNIVQSEVASSVASLYAKNPTFTVERKTRMDFAIWDESPQTL